MKMDAPIGASLFNITKAVKPTAKANNQLRFKILSYSDHKHNNNAVTPSSDQTTTSNKLQNTNNAGANNTTGNCQSNSTNKPQNSNKPSTATTTSQNTYKFTIDDYMTMNDSIDKFTTFVNHRTDYTQDEKKQIIAARTRQLEISDELITAYKKILTTEELNAYPEQPVGQALEPGAMPTNDTYSRALSKINEATKTDSNIASLTKELAKVKGGILGTFTTKVQKEKSKLLGF